ncbi:MAG TPA: hypothetical protein PLI09_10245 [Candidatus Hydrogenedentes bacterium]|nr:hypothetical protein [Candidatus Hydrogenedentota bacterium]
MIIRTQCKNCGPIIKLDFGNMSKEEALAVAEKMDNTPRECPGMHVELSGFRSMWSLDDAIHWLYDLGEGEEPTQVPTDKEYVEGLLAQGKDIIDGGCNTVPELNLPDIHSFSDLEHLGFGNFKNDTHRFLRCDSPHGTRFYERVPIQAPATCAV